MSSNYIKTFRNMTNFTLKKKYFFFVFFVFCLFFMQTSYAQELFQRETKEEETNLRVTEDKRVNTALQPLPSSVAPRTPPRCNFHILKKAKGHLIDLDGTLIDGASLIEGKKKDFSNGKNAAQRYFSFLEEKKMNYVFLSNGFKSEKCVRDKFSYEPFKLDPLNPAGLLPNWGNLHTWTAAQGLSEFLLEKLGYKKAKIYVLSTTVRCKSIYSSCFGVIKKRIKKEAREMWDLRMDLEWEDVLQWADLAQTINIPVYVVVCTEGSARDSVGGQIERILSEEKARRSEDSRYSVDIKKEDLELLVDPVHGKRRAAYATVDHDLLWKATVLVKNGAVLIGGAPDILQALPRNPKYPHINTHGPTAGAYEEFILLTAGNKQYFNKMKKYNEGEGKGEGKGEEGGDDEEEEKNNNVPVSVDTCRNNIGKGGNYGTKYMMLKALDLLEKQAVSTGMKIDRGRREEIFMIGDNLMTDIKAANMAGMSSILVLSGVHTLDDINFYKQTPTCYVNDVGDLADIYAQGEI